MMTLILSNDINVIDNLEGDRYPDKKISVTKQNVQVKGVRLLCCCHISIGCFRV